MFMPFKLRLFNEEDIYLGYPSIPVVQEGTNL